MGRMLISAPINKKKKKKKACSLVSMKHRAHVIVVIQLNMWTS